MKFLRRTNACSLHRRENDLLLIDMVFMLWRISVYYLRAQARLTTSMERTDRRTLRENCGLCRRTICVTEDVMILIPMLSFRRVILVSGYCTISPDKALRA